MLRSRSKPSISYRTRMVVEVVVVVELVGMGVEELDRSSCSGAKRLEVVVGQVGLVVLEVLVVLAYLAYLDLPCFLVVP